MLDGGQPAFVRRVVAGHAVRVELTELQREVLRAGTVAHEWSADFELPLNGALGALRVAQCLRRDADHVLQAIGFERVIVILAFVGTREVADAQIPGIGIPAAGAKDPAADPGP